MPVISTARIVLAAVFVAAVVGCSPAVRMPNWYQPGTAPVQRLSAVRFDPYPLPDVAPEVVGGRPLEYQRPFDETKRAQLFAPRPMPQPYPW